MPRRHPISSGEDRITAPSTGGTEDSLSHIRETIDYHQGDSRPDYGFDGMLVYISPSGETQTWLGNGQGESAKLLTDLRCEIQGQSLEILEYLWDRRKVTRDRLYKACWKDPVQPGAIYKAIERLNDKLAKYPVCVSNSGTHVILNRPD